MEVNPCLWVLNLLETRCRKFASFCQPIIIEFNDFIIFIILFVLINWHQDSIMSDPNDLCLQQVLFLSLKLWLSINFCLQVTSENILDLTSLDYVFWKYQWEFNPILLQIWSHPECILVDSFLPTRFSWMCYFISELFVNETLRDIKIILPT